MANISGDAFLPHRGLEINILSQPIRNGQTYYATDTHHLFWDANDSRHMVKGEGVGFIYGFVENDEEIVFDTTSESYLFPRNRIQESHDHYLADDIIINKDGTFYKILEVLETQCRCEKILVAGTGGGGGGGSNRWLTAVYNAEGKYSGFPSNYPYGQNITGTFRVLTTSGGQTANITIKIQDESDSAMTRFEDRFGTKVGEDFNIVIQKAHLKPGSSNYIIVQAEVNGEKSNLLTYTINCIDMQFVARSSWNPYQFHRSSDRLEFPYEIISTSGLPDELNVNVTYTLNNILDYPLTVNTENGSHDITPLFTGIAQGGHQLRVVAKTNVAGMDVTIGDLVYGIGWYTGDTSAMIWSPYNETKVMNYETIIIPYMVYDPLRDVTNDAEVSFYINSELQSEQTIKYNTSAYENWEINNYEPEQINIFTIQCRETIKSFEVEVVRNNSLNLEAVSEHCELWLTARGRSNSESALKRTQWNNNIKSPSLPIGTPILKGFNWSNNGWTKSSDGADCLRISNGASVEIPLNVLFNQADRTFEFDFLMYNATDYSKLITIKDISDDPENPVLESTVTAESGVIQYWENNKGIMIGTQEGLFSMGGTNLTSVRYADNNRIKLSFVVDGTGRLGQIYDKDTGIAQENQKRRLVYIYLNSVLSGVLNLENVDYNITNENSKIVINSDSCDIDLYNIRIYSSALGYPEIAQSRTIYTNII